MLPAELPQRLAKPLDGRRAAIRQRPAVHQIGKRRDAAAFAPLVEQAQANLVDGLDRISVFGKLGNHRDATRSFRRECVDHRPSIARSVVGKARKKTKDSLLLLSGNPDPHDLLRSTVERRYSGAGVGYQVASMVGGGFTPFIAVALIGCGSGSWHPVAGFLAIGCLIWVRVAARMKKA
jgi:hypothetical protein